MANRRFIDFPVATTVGANDIILIWQDGLNKQTTKATILSGLPEDLEDLADVNISGLTNGQILRYDSTTGNWVNSDQGDLDLNDLNDVSIVSPANGQVLVYNSSTSKWENSSAGLVPYVGAVTTVDLGAQGLRAGYVRFNTSVVSVPDEQGIMFWDADDETVDVILNGYTMKIGEDLFYPVKNQTGSTIAKGTAVRFNGTVGASGRLLIAPFIADGSVASSRFMGVTAEEILNGEDGKVLYFGRVRGINTDAFNEGDILYASTTVAGGYQTAIPVAPNNIVQVAAVVTKHVNNGTIFVRPTLASNLNTNEAVKLTSVADLDLLQYKVTGAVGLWENKTLAQVLGGTSSQFVKGDGSLDSTSYQPLLTNPVTGTGITNYLPKFTGTSTIGNSNLINDGSGNLGLGVTPSAWNSSIKALQIGSDVPLVLFHWQTGGNYYSVFGSNVVADATNDKYINNGFASQYYQNLGSHVWRTAPSGTAGNAITFTQAMTLTAGGNLGLGVTPSAWGLGKAIEFGNIGNSVWGVNTTQFNVLQNAYYDSSYKYATSNAASYYQQTFGGHAWYTAPSGTAGNNISFSPVMGITNGGNLLVGTTTDNGARLQVSGDGFFSGSSGFNRVRSTSTATTGFSGAAFEMYAYNGSSVTYGGGMFQTSSTFAYQQISANQTNIYGFQSGGMRLATGNAPIIFATGNSDLDFSTARMTITSSGNVGIGTAAPLAKLQINSEESVRLVNNGSFISFYNSDNTVRTGFLQMRFDNTTRLFVEANQPLLFGTNSTERLRITSSGNVLIGTTTDNGARLQVSGSSYFSQQVNIPNNIDIAFGTNTGNYIGQYYNGTDLLFYNGTGGASFFGINRSTGAATFSSLGTGTVYSNGGTLTNTNPSDFKLKENIAPINYGLSEILQLNAVTFNWKNDTINQGKQYGFIAQEVEKIMPDLVKKGEYLGLDKEAIFTTLVKAIQELKQEIDTLKN